MRKPFHLVLFLMLFVAVRPFAEQNVVNATGARAIPDHVTLTWTADPHTTQTITWRAAAGTMNGMAEYAKAKSLSKDVHRASAARSELATDLGTMSLFTVTLAGFRAGIALRLQGR